MPSVESSTRIEYSKIRRDGSDRNSADRIKVAAEPISNFVHRHPTVKMLALSFLLLIGVSLLMEGFDQHIPKGYVYFAMGFSVFVEAMNLRIRKKVMPVSLRDAYVADAETKTPPKAS